MSSLSTGTEDFVAKGEVVTVNLSAKLNKIDWQNNPTTLDELELIIIIDKSAVSKKVH